jgi:hypothetical protein
MHTSCTWGYCPEAAPALAAMVCSTSGLMCLWLSSFWMLVNLSWKALNSAMAVRFHVSNCWISISHCVAKLYAICQAVDFWWPYCLRQSWSTTMGVAVKQEFASRCWASPTDCLRAWQSSWIAMVLIWLMLVIERSVRVIRLWELNCNASSKSGDWLLE